VRRLADTTRETAHVAILDRGEVVVLEQAETAERVRISTYVGMRMPCHCTALGKILLAYLSEEELKSQCAGRVLEQYTDRSIVDPELLKAHLAEVRVQGYALDEREYDPGMNCLAVPVRNRDGRVVASVGISGPTTRMEGHDSERIIDAVRESGRRISALLGFLEEAGP